MKRSILILAGIALLAAACAPDGDAKSKIISEGPDLLNRDDVGEVDGYCTRGSRVADELIGTRTTPMLMNNDEAVRMRAAREVASACRRLADLLRNPDGTFKSCLVRERIVRVENRRTFCEVADAKLKETEARRRRAKDCSPAVDGALLDIRTAERSARLAPSDDVRVARLREAVRACDRYDREMRSSPECRSRTTGEADVRMVDRFTSGPECDSLRARLKTAVRKMLTRPRVQGVQGVKGNPQGGTSSALMDHRGRLRVTVKNADGVRRLTTTSKDVSRATMAAFGRLIPFRMASVGVGGGTTVCYLQSSAEAPYAAKTGEILIGPSVARRVFEGIEEIQVKLEAPAGALAILLCMKKGAPITLDEASEALAGLISLEAID